MAQLNFNFGYIPALPARPVTRGDDLDDGASSTAPTDAPTATSPKALPCGSAFSKALSVDTPADPILGIRDAFLADPTEDKLNLAVGVYRTAEGKPYVLETVKAAEAELLAEQARGEIDKEYLPADGIRPFCEASLKLLLGDAVLPALAERRVATAQSLSGLGGLHLAAQVIRELMPGATVHLPRPTWPIHPDVFATVGVPTAYYPYYDANTCGFDADGMLSALRALPEGSVVLLHACAHNPTGVDPTAEQWEAIASVVSERRLLPLVDSAYQGLASGCLEEDGAASRALFATGAEMILCQSYAKNMGLYGERTGCFSIVCSSAAVAQKTQEIVKRLVRLCYSSPPRHGAAIAAKILCDTERRAAWGAEVRSMAARLQEMRHALSEALAREECPPPHGTRLASWSHVLSQRGMFTYTGLTAEQVETLRERYHIYMPKDGRLAMASLTRGGCDTLARALKEVLTETADDEAEPPAKRRAV